MKPQTFFSAPLFLKFLYFAIFAYSSSVLCAEQFGLFTYRVINGNEVEITDYSIAERGSVDIPEFINSMLVTSIGDEAFLGCRDLTSITIPSSVTSIGDGVFRDCGKLTNIHVQNGNTKYVDVDGVLFNFSKTKLLQYPAAKTNQTYTIPSSVTSIGKWAFSSCQNLTSITIPSSVTSIGDGAFFPCTGLEKVIFLGDAPLSFGYSVFGYAASVAPGFTVQYVNGASGFTSPMWNGYPAEELNPVSSWLVKKGLSGDLDLSADINGDGVSLLMAYALNLDPKNNLQNAMPSASLDGDTLSMTFYGANQDVNYIVEVSEDMKTWGVEGVTLSEPDENGNRHAIVSRENNGEVVSALFLRLVVEQK